MVIVLIFRNSLSKYDEVLKVLTKLRAVQLFIVPVQPSKLLPDILLEGRLHHPVHSQWLLHHSSRT